MNAAGATGATTGASTTVGATTAGVTMAGPVDVLVIGSGVAGLSAALAAAPRRVLVVTKTTFGSGNSTWAQGGVAVALGDGDSPALHASDTVAVGVGLNDDDAVRVLTAEGPARARQLLALGARFDRDDDGELALGREAAHSVRRIVHAADATGAEIVRTLRAAVVANPAIEVAERSLVLDLLVDPTAPGGARVVGALAADADGRLTVYRAGAVVLATGGSGRLYSATTNPIEATADGLALAGRAGATLRDLEFVQFHPTALAAPGVDPLPLVTEALRGEGATIVDETGRRFLADSHPASELAPRDVVARAIAAHQLGGHRVFLDARAALGERIAERFPTVYTSCLSHGIDARRDLIPVSPAAHYHMGGVATDLDGRTDLAGLFAAGEVATTGVHGANRLASNSLLEGMVFGARAGTAAAELQGNGNAPDDPGGAAGAADGDGVVRADASGRAEALARALVVRKGTRPTAALGRRPESTTVTELRNVMWRLVGLVRDQAGLTDAVRQLDALDRPGLDPEATNLLLVARLVARAALLRTESRGAHQRTDFPATDPWWGCHIDVRLDGGYPITVRQPLAAPAGIAPDIVASDVVASVAVGGGA